MEEQKSNDNAEEQSRLISILHLSDIHLNDISEAEGFLSRLETDLKKQVKRKRLDYMVISGDIVNSATDEEYSAAKYFTCELIRRFEINRKNVIIVPGNHDINWEFSKEAYPFYYKYIHQLFPRNKINYDQELHKKRFINFSRFYKATTGEEYPLEYSLQCKLHADNNNRILFLALNSCRKIDHLNSEPEIDTKALDTIINNELNKEPEKYDDWIKIAVLHHPIFGKDQIENTEIMDVFAAHGFQLCMHGHGHKAIKDKYYDNIKRRIHIIGAGTFGAPAGNTIPGIPNQYNILLINHEELTCEIHERVKPNLNGMWEEGNKPQSIQLKIKDKKIETDVYLENFGPELTNNFINRENEQKKIMESLQIYKIIIIRGIPGVGKTELASKIREDLKNNNFKIYWCEIDPTKTFKEIITELAKFLRSNGYNKLYEYMVERKGNNFSEIANYIVEGLNSSQYILFFDNYHKLHPKTDDRDISVKQEMNDLFSKLAHNLKNSTVILTSVGIPEFVNMIDTKQKILNEEIEEFDSRTIKEYLSKEKLQLKQEQYNKIQKYIQHPMTLFFFASNAKKKDIESVIEIFKSEEYRDDLMKMFLDGFSNAEKEIVNVMSLLRTPLDADALSLIINKNKIFNKNNVSKNIVILKNKGLVKKKGDRYDLHDLLKQFCDMQIDPYERKSLHKSIGEYYMSLEITAESFMGASYHLIKNCGEISDEIIDYFLRTDDDVYFVYLINETLSANNNIIKTDKIFELFDKFINSNNIQVVTTFILQYGDYFEKIYKIDDDKSFQVYNKILKKYDQKKILSGMAQTVKKIAEKHTRKSIEIWSEIIKTYLFIWEEIPGNDSGRLKDFLKQKFTIDWVEIAKIEKIDNGKTIRVFTEQNSLLVKLNDDKTKLNIEIDDGRTDELIVGTKDHKLNIYKTNNLLAQDIVGHMNNVNVKSDEYMLFFNEIAGLLPTALGEYYVTVYNDRWGTGNRPITITDHLNRIRQLGGKESINYIQKNYATMIPWFTVQILSELINYDKQQVIELLRNVVNENKKSWPMILFQVGDILSGSMEKDDLKYLNIFLENKNDEFVTLVGIRALDLMSTDFESKLLLEYLNPLLSHDNITIRKISEITINKIKGNNQGIRRNIKNVNTLSKLVEYCKNIGSLPSILKTEFGSTEPFINVVMIWGMIKCIEKCDIDDMSVIGEELLLNELVLDASIYIIDRIKNKPAKFITEIYKYGYIKEDMSGKYASIPLIILMGNLVPETVDIYLKEIMKDEDEAAFSLVGNLIFYKNQDTHEREEILRYLCGHKNKDISGFADFLLNGLYPEKTSIS